MRNLQIKLNSLYFFILIILVNLYPVAQQQWLNLSLLEIEGLSTYSNLYLISGLLFPFIIILISSTNFSNYTFSENKIRSKYIKNLSLIVISNLLFLTFLLTQYVVVFINLIFQLISNLGLNISNDYIPSKFIFLIILILLLFKSTKLIIKRLLLLVFSFTSILVWLDINNILILDYSYLLNRLSTPNLFEFNNINLLNILILCLIEICFFFWSYISYENNLSNWKVLLPIKKDYSQLLNILLFYGCLILYYARLNLIN